MEQASTSYRPVTMLSAAIGLTAMFAAVEFCAGWYGNSLALMADAGHMLTDSGALLIALLAAWIARRPPTDSRTWGHGRVEILAAVVNAMVMLVLAGLVAWRAVERFGSPAEVHGAVVLTVAMLGVVVNLLMLRLLGNGGDCLNMRAAVMHVIGDLAGSIAAVVSGVLILWRGWFIVDPLLSLLICILITAAAVRILVDSVHILMEGAPAGIKPGDVEAALLGHANVTGVNELRLWQVGSRQTALSAHIDLGEIADWPATLLGLRKVLASRFEFDHVTLQPRPRSAWQAAHELQTETLAHAAVSVPMARPDPGRQSAGYEEDAARI